MLSTSTPAPEIAIKTGVSTTTIYKIKKKFFAIFDEGLVPTEIINGRRYGVTYDAYKESLEEDTVLLAIEADINFTIYGLQLRPLPRKG